MEFLLLLSPLRRARIASGGGGDADVAAACQTLGGISLHSESGKQPEEQPKRIGTTFFLASLSSLPFPLSNLAFWLYLNDAAAAAASPLPSNSVHL